MPKDEKKPADGKPRAPAAPANPRHRRPAVRRHTAKQLGVTVKRAHALGLKALKAINAVGDAYKESESEARVTLAYYGLWIVPKARALAEKVPASMSMRAPKGKKKK